MLFENSEIETSFENWAIKGGYPVVTVSRENDKIELKQVLNKHFVQEILICLFMS